MSNCKDEAPVVVSDAAALFAALKDLVQGFDVIEKAMKASASGDLTQAPFPLVGDEARAYLSGLTAGYLHALEMCNASTFKPLLETSFVPSQAESILPSALPDDMGFKSIYKDGPVGVALDWLRAALDCKSFHWDGDQRECAEGAHKAATEWLASLVKKNGPVPERPEPASTQDLRVS